MTNPQLNHISVVIIAKDAESTIEETLTSLSSFQEIILYLNNSTDKTKEIATTFSNVKIIKGEFLGFGKTKNKAAMYASNEWIFSLDSDEKISRELEKELQTLSYNQNELYIIKRDNYFYGKKIKYSGWGNDYLARIYNRKSHQYNENPVHEFIPILQHSQTIKLKHSFQHNALSDLNQFLFKIAKYSDLASQEKTTCSFIIVLSKAHFAFFKTYILQKGFLDGWRGFFIATSNFYGKLYRYTKRYINCKNIS